MSLCRGAPEVAGLAAGDRVGLRIGPAARHRLPFGAGRRRARAPGWPRKAAQTAGDLIPQRDGFAAGAAFVVLLFIVVLALVAAPRFTSPNVLPCFYLPPDFIFFAALMICASAGSSPGAFWPWISQTSGMSWPRQESARSSRERSPKRSSSHARPCSERRSSRARRAQRRACSCSRRSELAPP